MLPRVQSAASAKHLHPMRPRRATEPDMRYARVQQVGAVTRRVQPDAHYGGNIARPESDVFGQLAKTCQPGGLRAVHQPAAIGGGMVEITAIGHVAGMALRHTRQVQILCQRRKPGPRTRSVDAGQMRFGLWHGHRGAGQSRRGQK